MSYYISICPDALAQLKVQQAEMKFFSGNVSLGPVQTSNFTCAESNANEQEQ